MQNENETMSSFFGEAISVYLESDALADGVYIDAATPYPDACLLLHAKTRIVFTRTCWESCVATSGAPELWRFLTFFGAFQKARPNQGGWRTLDFSCVVYSDPSTCSEIAVRASLGRWDGEEGQPYLLFLLDEDD